MWSLLVKQRSNVLKKPVKVRWAFRSTFLCTTHYLESITSPFKKKRLGTDMNNQCLLIYFLISEWEKQTCVCFSVCALLAVVEGSLCSAWGVRRMLTNTHTHTAESSFSPASWMTCLSLRIKTIYETDRLACRVTWPVKESLMTVLQDRALLNGMSYSTRGKPGREMNSHCYLKVGYLDATPHITVINQH